MSAVDPTGTEAPTVRYALTIDQAAEATGLSRDSLEDARDRGELIFRYPNRKPIILPGDLQAWLNSLPSSPPERRAGKR